MQGGHIIDIRKVSVVLPEGFPIFLKEPNWPIKILSKVTKETWLASPDSVLLKRKEVNL